MSRKAKREDSLDPPSRFVLSSNQSCPPGFTYCPEVLVAAVAAPADFGVDK
jgi:hypothetical protein